MLSEFAERYDARRIEAVKTPNRPNLMPGYQAGTSQRGFVWSAANFDVPSRHSNRRQGCHPLYPAGITILQRHG
jgi:hypothetical protein